MFALGSELRYYLYRGPSDMRKGFDGLCGLVRQGLAMDPTDGSVYIFANRRGDRIKLLHWQRGGFTLYYKRLEQGTFALPPAKGPKTALTHAQLAMLVEGISVLGTRRKRTYRKN